MENVADTEMLRVFGIADLDIIKRDKIHNDELQRILDEEYYLILTENYEWLRCGQTIVDLAERVKARPASVVLYGAGKSLLRTLEYTAHFNIEIIGVCDQSWEAAKKNKYGCAPISLETLKAEHMNSYILITIEAPHTYLSAYNGLISLGFDKQNLFAIRQYEVR